MRAKYLDKENRVQHVVIVLPTYNERQNIYTLLQKILAQQSNLVDAKISVLVVDDSSPDGTALEVKKFQANHGEVYLLSGKKQGLGLAYTRGFEYAINHMQADVIFQMDADFSHNPSDIPRFLEAIGQGSDFVIGSRYTEGGSVPDNWSMWRKLNSRVGNIFARHIAGLSNIKDCTSGFRAIRSKVLEEMNLSRLGAKGYSFMMNLLHEAQGNKAKITEIPIQFIDRSFGESKLGLSDITEFIFNAFRLGLNTVKAISLMVASVIAVTILSVGLLLILQIATTREVFIFSIVALSTLMLAHGLFTLFWMIYAWENPKRVDKHRSPKVFERALFTFTALIPARHEDQVISDTIRAIDRIDYPAHKKEVIIICRYDDTVTIDKVKECLADLDNDQLKLVIYEEGLINKPHGLNLGLQVAKNDVVVIFDAEDEPHKDIYKVVNTVMIKTKSDVVQSGVQLMNYNSHWFSTLNVLEYFFWFKSALHFFSSMGVIPLGGNSVFFKKTWLEKIGGWDEQCLTEDADIGIRLSKAGAKTTIVYDQEHATREETPDTLSGFIKQRTRWNQGFLQVLIKGDWLKLPHFHQKLLAVYILIWPLLQAAMLVFMPIPILMMLQFKLPIIVAMISVIPLYILGLQIVTVLVALNEFIRDYRLKHSPLVYLRVLYSFIPFHLILGVSAIRGVARLVMSNTTWEKTTHVNAHRQMETDQAPSYYPRVTVKEVEYD